MVIWNDFFLDATTNQKEKPFWLNQCLV